METNNEPRFWHKAFGVIALIVAVVIMTGVKQCKEPEAVVEVEHVREFDTIYINRPAEVETVYIPVPGDVDTVEVVSDYYTERIYRDTVTVNNYVSVVVHDTVYNNKLQSVKYDFLTDFDTFSPIPIQANSKHNAIVLGFDAGFEHIALKAGYEWGKMGVEGGYDFVNKAPVVGLKFKVLQW